MGLGIRWVPASRLPRPPIWALAIGGGWLALLGLAARVEARTGQEAPTCLFRAITGHPCPTCGSTRAVVLALHGRWGEALARNPLVVTALLALLGGLVLRAATGRSLQVEGHRTGWLMAGLAALALNWAWVLLRS